VAGAAVAGAAVGAAEGAVVAAGVEHAAMSNEAIRIGPARSAGICRCITPPSYFTFNSEPACNGRRGKRPQSMLQPPSTTRHAPVTKPAPGPAR
jgi:hypothetical protein